MLPTTKRDTVALIYKAWEERADDGFRTHLGASQIGAECSRALWYGFRWAVKANHSGRMLRLFNTGQLAEQRFIDELRWIGCEVSEGPAPGQQWQFTAVDGHFGGSMDAACVNLPAAPNTWHCCEFKTHNSKSFKTLQNKGVAESKPQHYAQMQVYMLLSGMSRALYMAVNKDTDELYGERVYADNDAAEKLLERAAFIIYSEEPPLGVSTDPEFFQCKWCDYKSLCHGTDVPVPTCRSCTHVTPEKTGKWSCAYHGASEIPDSAQKVGCGEHRYIPILLDKFAEYVGGNQESNSATYRNKLTGKHFNNGEGGANDYQSVEIHFAQGKGILGDELSEEIRSEFGARIVENI